MPEGRAGRKLGRTTSERKALLVNLATALFRYEQIITTEAKAKELRRFAEKVITRAKKGGLNSFREVKREIRDKQVINKIFETLVPRFKERKGGYTKIIKLGYRQGDRARVDLVKLCGSSEKSE
jgi:large subunit ribosomal protein L17